MGKLDAANAARRTYRQRTNALTAALVAAGGKTPLDVMLGTMRELYAQAETLTGAKRRLAMMQASAIAKDAAPYVHPRLAAIEHKGDGGGPIQVSIVNFAGAGNAAAA